MIADVVVVGAGPAGIAAAITLSRAGRSVVVVDKATFPRDKCCGDGLTTGALRRYEALGLQPSAVESWQVVEDVFVRSPSGRSVRFPLPRDAGTYAAVARRADLDAAFVDVARSVGVEVVEDAPLRDVEVRADRVVVHAGDVVVEARYAIGADGMWSPLRKAVLGDEAGYLGEWHAFRQYFEHVGPRAASELWVWFEPDLLPGYAWSFPLPGGRANVGYGIQRVPGQPTKSMKGQWPELLQRPHVRELLGPDAVAEAPHKAWPIPARVDDVQLSGGGGRVLFAGDAARATDPMTGEGIGQALETGMAAAEAIVDAGSDRPDAAASAYESVVQRSLVVDHRLAAFLSRVLQSENGARGAVRIAATSDWTRRNFGRWLFEDYPRAMLATPGRWHRGMLTGPGAYRSR